MQRPIERLRAATREVHERLEQLPYARSVLDGTVDRAAYGSFLRAVRLVHLALEQVIETAADASFRTLLGEPGARRALLDRDLAQLGIDENGVDGAALQALVLEQRIRRAAVRDPGQLFGYLYVLEGSQLGGLVQHAALERRPDFAEGGLAYLKGAGRSARSGFEQFVTRLDAALGDPATCEAAVRGALAAFEAFSALLLALEPSTETPRWPVNELNGEAGRHALPEDVREVRAALAAGDESYRAAAYYAVRYGERGLRFTRSDSAWLATLAREDVALARRHVHWLARVLAARGMPRLLLERHLLVLEAKLGREVPEHSASYRTLENCAAELRQERTSAIPEARAQTLIAAFARTRTAEQGIPAEQAAELLVAAVADERSGVPGAVASLEAFLADAKRFSPEWVAAARRTLSAARGPH